MIRNLLLVFCVAFLLNNKAQAQIISFDHSWVATMSSYASSFTLCHDNGYATLSKVSSYSDWFYINRVNSNGTVIWTKIIQDTNFLAVNPEQIIETNDHGFCLVAQLIKPMNSLDRYGSLIIKLDSSGSIIWHQAVFINANRIFCNGIEEDQNGNLYFGCNKYNTSSQGPPQPKIWIAKLSASGQLIWSRETTNSTLYELQKIKLTAATRISLCTFFDNNNETKIIVLDSAGNHIGSHKYVVTSSVQVTPIDFISWPNGLPYAILMNKGSHPLYYQFDSTGILLNGILITTSPISTPVQLNNDMNNPYGLLYENTNGKAIVTDWNIGPNNGIELGGTSFFRPIDFLSSNDGSIAIWGDVPNSLTIPKNVRLIKTEPSQLGLPQNGCTVSPITLTTSLASLSDSVATTSIIPLSISFTQINLTLSPASLTTQVNCSVVGLVEEPVSNDQPITVYPNPCMDKLQIQLSSDQEYIFRLYTITGACVWSEVIRQTTELTLPHLPAGVYSYELANSKTIQRDKLILQH